MGLQPPRTSTQSRLSEDSYNAADTASRSSLEADNLLSEPASVANSRLGRIYTYLERRWRRIIGLFLLLVTVFLWTASNFLASTIFADNSYSKPYFVTYLNSATFIIPLIPILAREIYKRPGEARQWPKEFFLLLRTRSTEPQEEARHNAYYVDTPTAVESQELLLDDSQQLPARPKDYKTSIMSTKGRASVPETARLALEFSLLWFLANYFAAACLEYTTVASATILTSTSSVFTLIFGSLFRVERFTIRKLIGVVASLAGIIMISSIDLTGRTNDDEHRGDFPEKNIGELAIGNAMAFLSALFYGIYSVFMKSRLGDETRVNMPIFFGLVGSINVLLMWPGFIILHFTGFETFAMPSTGFIWLIIVFNSFASLIADLAWALAVLLTSPIVVTVGLSMSIPLSLVGEMIINNQTTTVPYWIGACIVLLSFLVINQEEHADEEMKHVQTSTTMEHPHA
ncbi:hypothetical protein AMS68_000488 [Peltaster fructicola]|uniref:Uncharacterized protein n=1 Tax=Peltaster fructicola TaxID=286661 RepID=A0A6H0XK08_9PEZI|nr:hypothetical protein AMS68_000488 [Peltaster fructicola]